MTETGDLTEALYTHDFNLNPFPAWSRLRTEAPVVWDGRSEVWMVTRYDDVTRVMLDHETFSAEPYEGIFRPVIGRTMVEMDGPDHDELRTIVSPALIGGKLARLQPAVERRMSMLLEQTPSSGEVDLIASITSQLPVMVMTDLLGLPTNDHNYLMSVVTRVMHALPGEEPGLSDGKAAFGDFSEYLTELVQERTRRPGDDLISSIANAKADNGRMLTPGEIASFITLLLVAGSETTDRALANFWYVLLTHSEVLTAIVADDELIEGAITEFMRYDGVVVYEDRKTTRDVQLGEVTIPGGQIVRVGLMSANNDETVFADPRSFILMRPDLRQGKENRAGDGRPGAQPHLGFGIGKHFCIGYQLARLEMTTATKVALPMLQRARLIEGRRPTMHVDWFHRYLDGFPVVLD